jgi:predicted SAM-dependent methyltransferase
LPFAGKGVGRRPMSLFFGRKMLGLIPDLFWSIRTRDARRSGDTRKALAMRFIRGRGIEIGALHNPLWTPPKTSVRYVDRLDKDGLRGHYPELKDLPLLEVDIVDDGERLTKFEPGSQDFIIANHFLEHTQDPIGTMRRHLEVLRKKGILYLAVPDKRFTFDKVRPETDFPHLLRDHIEGPDWSHDAHLHEFAALVMGCQNGDLEHKVNELNAINYSIHFHVWSELSFRDFLNRLITELHFPMKIEAFVPNTEIWAENICVIRKRA